MDAPEYDDEPQWEAPKHIKQNLKHNLGLYRFAGDIVDLYLGRMGRILLDVIDYLSPAEKNNAHSDSSEKPSSN